MEAFVGMISDEIQRLRELGHSDEEIARVIAANSKIEIAGEGVTPASESFAARTSLSRQLIKA